MHSYICTGKCVGMRNLSVFYKNNEGLLKKKNFPTKMSNKKKEEETEAQNLTKR